MSRGGTILGTSKVDPHFRITLVQPVPKLLGVRSGDLIVFVQDEKGNVILRVSSIPRELPLKKMASPSEVRAALQPQ